MKYLIVFHIFGDKGIRSFPSDKDLITPCIAENSLFLTKYFPTRKTCHLRIAYYTLFKYTTFTEI